MQDEVNGGEEVVDEAAADENVVDPDNPEVFDTNKPTSPNAVGGTGIKTTTNPPHVVGETYEDYVAKEVAAGHAPASEAEWANAEQTEADETDDTEVDGEDDDTEVDDEDDDEE